jgi:hypothetical protein
MVCLHFPNYSPFERYKSLKILGGWINERVKARNERVKARNEWVKVRNELIVSRFGGDLPPLFIVKRKFIITYTIVRQVLCQFQLNQYKHNKNECSHDLYKL